MWLLKQPTQPEGIEASIESLKVQLANDEISPRLAGTKIILQSILSLSPHRSYKKKTAALAQQAAHIALRISALVDRINEIPQLVQHCLEQTLRDIQFFVQFETQSSTLHRLLCGKTISARYAVLEERLSSLLVHCEQCITNLQSADSISMHMSRSRMASLRSANNGDVVLPGGEIFPNAHDLTVNGGNYYSGPILIQQTPQGSHQESGNIMKGIVQGMRVIAFEDVSIASEIHASRGYRLHSGKISGKARVVKVYQGPLAKERCLAAAKFHKTVMHPSFLHMIGVPPMSSEVPFLVFNGEFKGSLEASIATALKKDLRNSLILGIQTVIGLSSGLDYLRDVNYHFMSAGLQHFGVFLSLEGDVIISFDPYIVCTNTGEDSEEEQGSSSEADKPLFIFHGLCKQTFDAACQTHYYGKHIERAYDDILENEDRFEDVDGNPSLGNRDSSDSSENAFPLHHTILDPVVSSMPSSSRKSVKKPPTNGHRRELVWKSENSQDFSLEDILREFKTFLSDLPTSSGPELRRRRGRYTARTAHRCPGYNRTEITLTPNITRSAIVTHSTPLPHEICPVCKQIVKDAEIFNCICGGEDDESMPTIQCLRCHEWHHRPCLAGFKFTDQCFTCPDCGPLMLPRPQIVNHQPMPGRQHHPNSHSVSHHNPHPSTSTVPQASSSMSTFSASPTVHPSAPPPPPWSRWGTISTPVMPPSTQRRSNGESSRSNGDYPESKIASAVDLLAVSSDTINSSGPLNIPINEEDEEQILYARLPTLYAMMHEREIVASPFPEIPMSIDDDAEDEDKLSQDSLYQGTIYSAGSSAEFAEWERGNIDAKGRENSLTWEKVKNTFLGSDSSAGRRRRTSVVSRAMEFPEWEGENIDAKGRGESSTWEKVKNTFLGSDSSAGRRRRPSVVIRERYNPSVSRGSDASLTYATIDKSDNVWPSEEHQAPLMQCPSAASSNSILLLSYPSGDMHRNAKERGMKGTSKMSVSGVSMQSNTSDKGHTPAYSHAPATLEKLKNPLSEPDASVGRRFRTNSIVTRERRNYAESSGSRESGTSFISADTNLNKNDNAGLFDKQQAPFLIQSPSPSSILLLSPPSPSTWGSVSPILPPSTYRPKYHDAKLHPFPGMLKVEDKRRMKASLKALEPDNITPSARLAMKYGQDSDNADTFYRKDASSSTQPKLPMTLTGVKQWLAKNSKKNVLLPEHIAAGKVSNLPSNPANINGGTSTQWNLSEHELSFRRSVTPDPSFISDYPPCSTSSESSSPASSIDFWVG